MKRKWTITGMAILSAAALIPGIFFIIPGDRSFARIQKAGVIRIGYAIEAPHAFLLPNGEVTGESPEIAMRIIPRLGVGIHRIEWCLTEFNNLIPELKSGRFDVIGINIFITPERAKQVRFSEPAYHIHQGLLVAKGNPKNLHGYWADANGSSTKIAVVAGAVEETILRRLGFSDRQLIIVPDALTGRVSVETGIADGLALTNITIRWMAMEDQLGKTEMAVPFQQPEIAEVGKIGYGAFAFRLEDRQLQTAWNVVMKSLIRTPEYIELISKYGFSEADLPGKVTTREILTP